MKNVQIGRIQRTDASEQLIVGPPARPAEALLRNQKWSKETCIALTAALGILAHLIGKYILRTPAERFDLPLILVLLVGGVPLLFDLIMRAVRCEFGSDLLAGLSIAVSVVLGEYLAGAIVVLMLSGGTALEHHATHRASSVLGALAKRMPRSAHRITESGINGINLDQVRVADRLAVFPHEICPVDGTVIEGHSTMDESYLTGEPFLIAKAPVPTFFRAPLMVNRP